MEVTVLSKSTRSSSMESKMEPKMTSDGKYMCEADKKTFNTREDYNKHCSETHPKSSGSKGW